MKVDMDRKEIAIILASMMEFARGSDMEDKLRTLGSIHPEKLEILAAQMDDYPDEEFETDFLTFAKNLISKI